MQPKVKKAAKKIAKKMAKPEKAKVMAKKGSKA